MTTRDGYQLARATQSLAYQRYESQKCVLNFQSHPGYFKLNLNRFQSGGYANHRKNDKPLEQCIGFGRLRLNEAVQWCFWYPIVIHAKLVADSI